MIALGNLALAPAFMTFPLLVSLGRIRDTLVASLISLPPSAAILIASASFGLTAVAASVLVTAPLQMFVALLFVRRAIDMSWKELFGAVQRSALIASGTAALPILVVILSPNGFALDLGEAALALLGGAAGWLAGLFVMDHPLRTELQAVWRTIEAAVRSRKLAKDPHVG